MEAMTTQYPCIKQLKERFLPFDTRYNSEKFRLNLHDSILKRASVLIPLFYKGDELHVLLTVRNKNMSSHAGNVAFPGGMWEPGDIDDVATALREAQEEVGIQPSNIDIVAVLSSNIVRPNSIVSPVVGILASDFKLTINPREVDFVFDLPLKRFLSLESRTCKWFTFDVGFNFNVYHFSDTIKGRELDTWGFTAMLCIEVAMVAFQSDNEIHGYNNEILTKENCFNTILTQAIVDKWNIRGKL